LIHVLSCGIAHGAIPVIKKGALVDKMKN